MRGLAKRWFWTVYKAAASAAFAVMLMMVAGGQVERAVDPVLSDIDLDQAHVTRTTDKACWSWDAFKRRMGHLADIDVVLDRVDGERSFPEIIDDGRPWSSTGAHPAGHTVHHDQCVAVPPDLRASGKPFILRFRILFDGALPLWRVPVDFPAVIVPGTPPAA